MIRHAFFLVALLTSIGCNNRDEAKPQIAPIPPPKVPKIQPESSYSIRSDTDESPVRRAVDVELKTKVAPEVLRKIALEIKSKEERPHERTAIFYYLPTPFPELAGVPWASTHFRPDVDVKILGLTQQEEDKMRSLPLDHKGKRIGAWLQDNQYKTLDLIYEEDGAVKIAEFQLPAERADSDMIETPSPNGRRFRKVKGSNIYEVDQSGNLRIFNTEDQLISASKPMK
jgi:hypothetical protein